MADSNANDYSLVEIAAEIVSAYVGNNALNAGDLPKLIADVYATLGGLGNAGAVAEVEAEPLKPAVSVRKSITPDYLICLEDGKKFKSLKRHLAQLGLTPAQYREKWGLPADYPMVAPNYSATRSALARENGLGRKPAEVAPPPAPAKRGRKAAAPAA